MSDRKAARAYYQQSADLARGVDNFLTARGLIDAGYLLLLDRKYESYHQAIEALDSALPLTESPLLREAALGNLAEAYADLGDWRQSISAAEAAEKLAGQIENRNDQEVWLIDLGRALSAVREFDKAEPRFLQALTIAKAQNDNEGKWRCLTNLTQLALKRHDLKTAEQHWKEESILKVGSEGKAYIAFDTAEIAKEHGEFQKAEKLLATVLETKVNDSLNLIAERELGNVLWNENEALKADQAFREAINKAEDVMAQLPPERRMSFLDLDGFYDSYVRFLVAEGRRADALGIAERGRAQILSQLLEAPRGRSAFDLRKIQEVLKRQKQVALAYWLTDEESFLWVITGTELEMRPLPPHKKLRPLIDRYKNEVVGLQRSIEDSQGSQELYKTLIQPAESLIRNGWGVVIVPSKILSLVSFEALVVPGAQPHYWIDDAEIETASSLAFLARSKPPTRQSAKKKKELLLLGAPLQADKAFPTLPNATEEMNRIRSHFSAAQEKVISGKDAIPEAYRANHPGEYRFIHIDAHSDASELNPLRSFVVLSQDPQHSYKLFADEITETPLHADLVTLSACYGAGTRWYNGEGIVGLGWAFLRAGAHQVVASLWTVDDASTPQLMDDFYGELSKGKSAAEALRTAKRNMLHTPGQRSRPFYWASLQLYTGS